ARRCVQTSARTLCAHRPLFTAPAGIDYRAPPDPNAISQLSPDSPHLYIKESRLSPRAFFSNRCTDPPRPADTARFVQNVCMRRDGSRAATAIRGSSCRVWLQLELRRCTQTIMAETKRQAAPASKKAGKLDFTEV